MDRTQINAELRREFDTREEAETRAAQLGPEWHVHKSYRERGKFQLVRDV